MKKLKGLFAALIMLCSTSVFAGDFDWSQCWCNYGAGIEKGDMIVDVAVGLNDEFFRPFGQNSAWSLPYMEAAFDVALPIWKLPFSWGGFYGLNIGGANGNGWNYSLFSMNFGGQVKYHVLLPVDNLDVYAGIRLGANLAFSNAWNPYFGFYYDGFLGAHYFLNDNFGFVAEFGYPVWLKAGISLKF